MTDGLPAGPTFVSFADCSGSTATLTCDVAAMPKRRVRTLTVTVEAAADLTGEVANTAIVRGTGIDPDVAVLPICQRQIWRAPGGYLTGR